MTDEPTEEDILADALVDQALADFTLPPHLLDEVRDELADWLVCHPDGRRLLRQLKDDPVVAGSGDVARPDALKEEAAKAVANLSRHRK